MLVVITNNHKEVYQKFPKLDDDGNTIPVKKPKQNGTTWKEKQVLMKMPQEFYLVEREEMKSFIETHAINASDFDTEKYFKMSEPDPVITQPEAQPLVDANGLPIKSAQKKAPAKKKPAAKKEEKAPLKVEK